MRQVRMPFKKLPVTQVHIQQSFCLQQKEEDDYKNSISNVDHFLELEQEAGILLQCLGPRYKYDLLVFSW